MRCTFLTLHTEWGYFDLLLLILQVNLNESGKKAVAHNQESLINAGVALQIFME